MSTQSLPARRVIVGVVSVMLIAVGLVVALQDLGTAAKVAGIGSFIVGLGGAVMTATSLKLAFRASRQEAGRTAPSPESASQVAGHQVTINGSGTTVVGNRNKVTQTTTHYHPESAKHGQEGGTERSA